MCRELAVTLPATGTAIAAGRLEIETFLHRSYFDAPGGFLDDAALVGSELLTNAMRAGAPRLSLCLVAHVDEVEVAVVDEIAGRPSLQVGTPGPTQSSGRGLGVVEHVARTWGVAEAPPGKRVWCLLDVPPGTGVRFNCVRDAQATPS